MQLALPEPLRALWARTEPVRGPTFFLGGMAWDYATLRIERAPDNLLLMVYLAVLFAVSVIELRHQHGGWVPAWMLRWPTVPALASQFLLGALLSAFAVHVFGAVHPGPVAWFLALLLVLAAANEAGVPALRGRVARVALLGFLIFQTFSLIVPFVAGTLVGPLPPLAVTACLVVALLALVLAPVAPDDPPLFAPEAGRWATLRREAGGSVLAAACTLGGLLVLIALGVVPPLPLVMRDAVVARDVRRVAGDYELVEPHRRNPLLRPLLGPPRIAWAPGEKVTVFTAVFAPAGLELDVQHVWEWWDADLSRWSPSDRITQRVKGGRVDGFRTWSTKRNLRPGAWRVRVQTTRGREIGRVRLTVDPR